MVLSTLEFVDDHPRPAASASPLGFSIPLAVVHSSSSSSGSAASSPRKFAGVKRSERDEPATHSFVELDGLDMSHQSDDSDFGSGGAFDLSLVSPVCHQLLETKRRMLEPSSPPADGKAAAFDGQSPRTDTSSRSDDENGDPRALRPAAKKSPHSPDSLEGLSPEAIQQRKAQRRREQVRAASRRCRDRQRKETEDLRKKVFQLEEFIAHTIKTYEWELRQQRDRADALERDNAELTQQLASTPLDLEPELERELQSPPFDPIKPEEHAIEPTMSPISKYPPSSPSGYHDSAFWNDEGYPEMLLDTVADTTNALIKMLGSTTPLFSSAQIFGWDFDFWIEGPRYFAKNRKFFAGFRAYELAQRQHHVDIGRYMETFTEIKEKETLKVINEHVKIMRTVKSLPGKPLNQSLTAQFASPVDHGHGGRWVVAERSIGELKSLKYGVEKECNGYVFEDVTKVLPDGTKVEGCLVQGVGGFESDGKSPELLVDELMKAFSTVVLRWEGLFVNDYIQEDAGFADIELDFDLRG